MNLIVIRHGQTVENKEGIHQGHSDGNLSELGKKQAQATAEALKKEKFDVVYCSPLGRAYDTAKIIMQYHSQEIIKKDALKEQFFGTEFEGKNKIHVDWTKLPPSAEQDVVFVKRIQSFLTYLVEHHKNKTVLIVAHGGTGVVTHALIKKIVLKPNCCPNPRNCSISRYIFDGSWKEVEYDNIDHQKNITL